jgi:hypothetical protein
MFHCPCPSPWQQPEVSHLIGKHTSKTKRYEATRHGKQNVQLKLSVLQELYQLRLLHSSRQNYDDFQSTRACKQLMTTRQCMGTNDRRLLSLATSVTEEY